jgi:hypothetical protein
MRRLPISIMVLVLCSSSLAHGQSERASALIAALSTVLRRDSVMCSDAKHCSPIGLLVSFADSAHLGANGIGLVPVTPASLDALTLVDRVLSIQDLQIIGEGALIRVADLAASEPDNEAVTPGQPKFRQTGHGWEIRCNKKLGIWTVTGVNERIR